LGSPWIDIDVKLIEEAKTYAETMKGPLPVYAGLSINIEAYTVATNRTALLNRYSRARADGYLFYVDSFNERTNNPLQIKAYLELLSLFQKLGKPVIACRVGTLGLGLLAAGVDGMTSGIASLSGFSENNLLQNRSTGYNMTTKYYIPKIMLTLPTEMAQDILAKTENASLRCSCPHCKKATTGLDRVAKTHFLHVRTGELKELNDLQNRQLRINWFNERIKTAIQHCENIQRQAVVRFGASQFSHLRAWQQVFQSAK